MATGTADTSGTVLLTGGGTSLVVHPRTLRVLHWGAKLAPHAARALADDPPAGGALLPLASNGHPGRPALAGDRRGLDWSPAFSPAGARADERSATLHARDEAAALRWTGEFELLPSGLLRLRHTLVNEGAAPYRLEALTPVLPLPARAGEVLDFTGRWAKERQPQRRPLGDGAWVREGRRGRPGHDSPFLLAAGVPGFGFAAGEVWAVHVGWSGDHVWYAERSPSGAAYLGGGELPLPGEYELAPGEAYTTPWLHAAYSSRGLDGVSAAFHDGLRARPGHPDPRRRPRPVVLNTWEAAYFDHSAEKLFPLAERAAEAGVERFVLDDGWFLGRRDDTAGLGDWVVDEAVWPRGLGPLVAHVRGLGMEFGLWVEPEMVNPDSELYRAHPDWVLHAAERLPPAQRHQQVLDLCVPEAYALLLERLDALLAAHDIAYLKWDHNRDLVEPGHAGRAAAGRQTRAAYRLMDELRRRHPGLEIESCASGGARVDLGVLERTDRVWASDCNDALERYEIQRGTTLLLPPELVGAHVGPERSHSTGRRHDLAFRAAAALFGHLGVEWDLTAASEDERAELAAWIALYKRHRTLLHTGRLHRPAHPDPAVDVTAAVAHDRSEALVRYAQLAATRAERPAPLRLPGLDPDAAYRVEAVGPCPPRPRGHAPRPPWYPGPVERPGQLLAETGLSVPGLYPETALLLHLTRVDA